jgi:protein-S-isoprenylcysteine O-methyltransferase Ste14
VTTDGPARRAGLSPLARARLLLATNVVLSAWLLFEAGTVIAGASPGDLHVVVPQAGTEVFLAVLMLMRPPPGDVRLTAPVLAAAIVSNGHFALFDFEAPSGPAAAVGSVLLVGAVYVAAWAHVVLGRSFSILPAVRTLRTRGPYRLVRHPIYAALVLTDVGLALSRPTPRNALLAATGVVAHVVRVLQEERMWLRRSEYRAYRRRTRRRLLPFVW